MTWNQKSIQSFLINLDIFPSCTPDSQCSRMVVCVWSRRPVGVPDYLLHCFYCGWYKASAQCVSWLQIHRSPTRDGTWPNLQSKFVATKSTVPRFFWDGNRSIKPRTQCLSVCTKNSLKNLNLKVFFILLFNQWKQPRWWRKMKKASTHFGEISQSKIWSSSCRSFGNFHILRKTQV